MNGVRGLVSAALLFVAPSGSTGASILIPIGLTTLTGVASDPTGRHLADVEILSPKLDKTEPLRSELLHFVDCIRHNRKPWASGEHGIEALKLALQITEELERYELSEHKQARSFLPSWAKQIARTATKSVLGADE